MALPYPFVSMGELGGPRKGKPFSADGIRTYQRQFLVVVADKAMGPVELCYCPGLPKPYMPYIVDPARGESDLSALCIGIDFARRSQKEGELSWIGTYDYSTDLRFGQGSRETNFPNQQDGTQNNPEFEPPEIEWDFQEHTRALTKDRRGEAFVNSALRLLSPAPTFEFAYPVLNITRNELSFDREQASRYAYAINKTPFLNAQPGTAQCLPPKAVVRYKGNLAYWRVSYRIRFGIRLPDGSLLSWQPTFIDNGVEELVLKPGMVLDPNLTIAQQRDKFDWKRIKDSSNANVTQPVPLDGFGKKLLPNAQGKMEAQLLGFDVYPEEDLNDLFVVGLGG